MYVRFVPMKILEIINLPTSAINFIGGQFKYLSEEGGYEMHLICTPGGGIEEFCKENGVNYHGVQLNRQISLIQDIKSLHEICKYIKQEHIDIVIAHQSKGRLLGMIASAITGVKYRIVFAHGVVYETMTGLKKWLMMLNDKFVSSLATKVVCVSEFVVKRRIADKIDHPEKLVLLGRGSCNGLDTINKFNPSLVSQSDVDELKKKYSITHDDFVLGFCGRLVRDKGIIELVEAFKDLKEKYTEKSIKMLIIGEPEKRDGLPERILYYLTHTEGIIFTGRIPFSDIQKYYLLMNVLVLPTHREGFGMVAVEASAMECPAIVSSYTGCAETVIDGKTGLYINQSVSSIVSAIEKCFDKDYAKYLGKNGREFVVNNFEHTLIRKYMLNLINKVIA